MVQTPLKYVKTWIMGPRVLYQEYKPVNMQKMNGSSRAAEDALLAATQAATEAELEAARAWAIEHLIA